MLGLLRETWDELAKRPLTFLKCFWLTIVLELLVAPLFVTDVGSQVELFVVLLLIFLIAITPGAVRWHRSVLSNESVNWAPKLPDLTSLVYAIKVIVAFVIFTAISKIAASLVQDIGMPIVGALTGGMRPTVFGYGLALMCAEAIAVLAFVYIFGKLMLSLPEGALETSQRGFRSSWTEGGKKDFLRALALVYMVPAMFVAVDKLISTDYLGLHLSEINTILFAIVHMFVGIAGVVFALNLLSVAYNRNLHSGSIEKPA